MSKSIVGDRQSACALPVVIFNNVSQLLFQIWLHMTEQGSVSDYSKNQQASENH